MNGARSATPTQMNPGEGPGPAVHRIRPTQRRDLCTRPTTRRRDRLSTYRLRRVVGEGGAGVVHLATDRAGRTVVVKRPRSPEPGSLDLRDLANEARALSRLKNPRVVELVDADTTSGRPFLALRYIPGQTLAEHVRATGPLPEDLVIRFAYGLAQALAGIHASGVIHRDINPSNVILCPNPARVVVIDFGQAVRIGAPVHNPDELTATHGYFPPESCTDLPTPALDIFAWAATVTYAATARRPHGTGPTDILLTRAEAELIDLRGTPTELTPLLREALASEATRRPSASRLASSLGGRAPRTPPCAGVES